MNRNIEHQFISTDVKSLTDKLIASYEEISGSIASPASPERLMLQWAAEIIVQERAINNYTGNQNIPSSAEGQNLDGLAALFQNQIRPEAQSAKCTVRFSISAPQNVAVLIPVGTRVTDTSSTLMWRTTADNYIIPGNLAADVMVQCLTVGTVGNGYSIGQINTIVDLFDYYDSCGNVTESDGGADRATDDEFYELMRTSQDSYSTAGASGSYEYYAKKVSTKISDVVPITPTAGHVDIYVLMDDGTPATPELKNAVLSSCNSDYVRPLTDFVQVKDPEMISYNVVFTYFIPNNIGISSTDIQKSVQAAVEQYVMWQCGKLGRDINPDELRQLVKQTGVKRIELLEPAFSVLRDGKDNRVPQCAAIGDISITNGGYEDE